MGNGRPPGWRQGKTGRRQRKSEAMLASYKQRFSQGNFMKPDLLGYDRSGVNEITVNEEEAVTVLLIFMLYLAGTSRRRSPRSLSAWAGRRTRNALPTEASGKRER